MQTHQVKSKYSKKKKRVGRGGKRGTYSGKGLKGQKSRAGHKMRPEFRDIIKKIPKKRGYRMSVARSNVQEVNLGFLDKIIKEGETVTPKLLALRKVIKISGRKFPEVKLLASGKLTKKLLVKDCQVSAGAKKRIEELGGQVLG
ncbi:MAG: 50S ribosomal protein L15 [Candidatus Niyogibacteria bacterium CG10_big_fil_rev_8_21_14_0_10_42_19]|uniref:Large ribosomal subunit protein uL15 n=1 Tax=Candidatus Niyogibacteria bacterium CG10_big_fil_rev_8_21_14_0_10_42_19 TaxID=1974725 RepID=A0A2H0TFE0_9BACT|nr:MAG: 50S ribosomal protein L15 [Candidatus Niyogibacteria bacterium CG10_big_fil_rev_8_21_14_0_10_42_19]